MALATRVDRPLMRVSAGRLRLSFVIPALLLICRGARTGTRREVPLLYVPAGNDVLLIGSNGGRTRDPAWCHNLRQHPDVECAIAGERRAFAAVELTGSERDRAWQQALAVYPGYRRYAGRAGRRIPVFRLHPRVPTEPSATTGEISES